VVSERSDSLVGEAVGGSSRLELGHLCLIVLSISVLGLSVIGAIDTARSKRRARWPEGVIA
jgi:hypothetical protein